MHRGPPDAPVPPGEQPDGTPTSPTPIEDGAEDTSGVSYRCGCDRCWSRWRPWPLSEVPSTSRTWGAFEPVRPLDVVDAHGPCSWTELERLDDEAAA